VDHLLSRWYRIYDDKIKLSLSRAASSFHWDLSILFHIFVPKIGQISEVN